MLMIRMLDRQCAVTMMIWMFHFQKLCSFLFVCVLMIGRAARAECSSQHENILVQGAKKSHKKFLPGKQAWTGFFRMCLHGKIAVALTFEIPLAQTRRNHAPCAELCPRLEHRNLIGNCKKFRNQRKKSLLFKLQTDSTLRS